MENKEFEELVGRARERQNKILRVKGKDYTAGDPDRLANFKELAKELGVHPRVVWWIYFRKHISAIMAWIRTGKVESEGLEGRFDDAINYLYLGEAVFKEEDNV